MRFPLHKPYIQLAYIGEYLHFRYLKCLVMMLASRKKLKNLGFAAVSNKPLADSFSSGQNPLKCSDNKNVFWLQITPPKFNSSPVKDGTNRKCIFQPLIFRGHLKGFSGKKTRYPAARYLFVSHEVGFEPLLWPMPCSCSALA